MTDRGDPPSVRIAAEIRRRITSGELRPGDRVPSARQITGEWGVAIATATKVLAGLRREGLVRAVPGVGTIVEPSERPPARTRRASAGRGAESELTRERVVATAIAIADSDGLDALSMRRVATDLSVATMTLYRHVPGKDELVLLMADAVCGECPLPEPPPEDWRTGLTLVAREQWATYRRHEWFARVTSMTRPDPVPNAMAQTDWTMRALDGLGLGLETVLLLAVTLANHVRGTAENLEAETQAEHDTGLTAEEWMSAQGAALEDVFAARPLPMLSRVARHPEIDLDIDVLFEFGLQRLLDGFATFIAR